MSASFSGNPQRYRKASILLSAYCIGFVYLTFALIKYFAYGESWVFGWQPILLCVVLIVIYARFCFRWIMRLDAQYGSGKGWKQVSTRVKLPELRRH